MVLEHFPPQSKREKGVELPSVWAPSTPVLTDRDTACVCVNCASDRDENTDFHQLIPLLLRVKESLDVWK